MIHGDDFISAGGERELLDLKAGLEKEFEITTSMVGPSATDNKELKVLNRTIKYHDWGIEYQPDPRHAEIIVKELKLED